jgi:hypothetical protein
MHIGQLNNKYTTKRFQATNKERMFSVINKQVVNKESGLLSDAEISKYIT